MRLRNWTDAQVGGGNVLTAVSTLRVLQAGIILLAIGGCANSGVPVGSAPESAFRPVKSFDFDYRFNPDPGLRAWSLDAFNRWHERYPNGTDSVFDEVSRGSLWACPGFVATNSVDPDFHVFVPDMGCPRMIVSFIGHEGIWKMLGEMRDIS